MIQNVLREIGGIGLYGVISVCLFFLVFTVAFLRACRLSQGFVKSMSRLPLDDGQAVRKQPLSPSAHE
ncbi:MAG TPA: CcoQ/FixQ family Cbb3-type cytochrome c oxidase assembly chaperone [Verrucomicrobiae bacterium]|nr:CcoQ/FixQ family Cbb3-type cytochrome c oxidase assembly chaperone [Verrucomicrobiae bacterium]